MAIKSGVFGGGRGVIVGRTGSGASKASGVVAQATAKVPLGVTRTTSHEGGGRKGFTQIPDARPPVQTPAPTTTTQPAPAAPASTPASSPPATPVKPEAAASGESGQPSTSEIALEEPPPPLPRVLAYILVDGHTVDALDHLKTLSHELDAASGHHIDLVVFGDPIQSGEASKSHRSAAEAESIPARAARYIEDVVKTHRERHHVVEASLKQARLFGISDRQLPCVALVDNSSGRVLHVLSIEPEWCESEPARRAMGRALLAGVRTDGFVKASTDELVADPDAIKLGDELVRIGHAIGVEVFRATGSTSLGARLTVPAWILLDVQNAAIEIIYRRQYLDLTITQFKLLRRLAQQPGQSVDVTELARAASRRVEEAGFNEVKWGKEQKLQVMRRLRSVVGKGGIEEEEVEALISSTLGGYRLNLTRDAVLVH